MAIVVIIVCVIAYMFIQASLMDSGETPRSRGSLRYQRRKARRLGVDAENVHIDPRGSSWEPPQSRGDSHVGDLARGLSWGLGFIILLIGGGFVMMASGLNGDWFWGWALFLLIGQTLLWRWRTGRWF